MLVFHLLVSLHFVVISVFSFSKHTLHHHPFSSLLQFYFFFLFSFSHFPNFSSSASFFYLFSFITLCTDHMFFFRHCCQPFMFLGIVLLVHWFFSALISIKFHFFSCFFTFSSPLTLHRLVCHFFFLPTIWNNAYLLLLKQSGLSVLQKNSR